MMSLSPTAPPRSPRRVRPIVQVLLAAWMVLCFVTYIAQAYDRLPRWLPILWYAEYLQ